MTLVGYRLEDSNIEFFLHLSFADRMFMHHHASNMFLTNAPMRAEKKLTQKASDTSQAVSITAQQGNPRKSLHRLRSHNQEMLKNTLNVRHFPANVRNSQA